MCVLSLGRPCLLIPALGRALLRVLHHQMMRLDPPPTPCYRHRRDGSHRHRREGGGLCTSSSLLCPGLGLKEPAPAGPEREGGGGLMGATPVTPRRSHRGVRPRPPRTVGA